MKTLINLFLSVVLLAAGVPASAQDEVGSMVPAAQPAAKETLLSLDLKPVDLRVYGDKSASKTIYLFSSLSCPHCAVFHQEVMPDLMKRFIESKQAKLVIVDMPYDSKAITATLYARCVSPQNYEAYIDRIYSNLANLTYSENPRQMMADFAIELGEKEEPLEVCVSTRALRQKIMDQRNNLSGLYLVNAMPTLVVTDNKGPLRITGTDKEIILRDVQNKLEEK